MTPLPEKKPEKTTLGAIIIREQLVTAEQVALAKQLRDKEGIRLSSALARLGYVTKSSMLDFLSAQFAKPTISFQDYTADPTLFTQLKISVDYARNKSFVPISFNSNTIVVAICDPMDELELQKDLSFKTSMKVEFVLALEDEIFEELDRIEKELQGLENKNLEDEAGTVEYKEDDEDDEVPEAEILSTEVDSSIVKMVNIIILDAIRKGASDIHFEQLEKEFHLRYRIDGVLYLMRKLSVKFKSPVISRIKIMSNLDIAERRLPQDGRITVNLPELRPGSGKREISMRVSTLPTIHGENVVLRILDQSNLQLDLTKLGFEKSQMEDLQKGMYSPHGMILVTGPTGSGKTTTLYSILSNLNVPGKKLMSAEDPVEYKLPGISQVHVREDIGLTFANALRTFLRQDPDIIMVGEIRDFETAEIAIKSALTGHLVLSTLHTNDAPSTISRLQQMGAESYLLVSSVNLVIAQRLVRRLCPYCKTIYAPDESELKLLSEFPSETENIHYFKHVGCPQCSNIGYKGREAIYELMYMKEELKDFILNGATSVELKREARRLGMLTLRDSGIEKIRRGTTTIQEVLNNSKGD